MRAPDATAAARSFVAAGRQPQDPANVARRPFVKICGVTDAGGALAAVRSGADAIGLNLVPGTPRVLEIDEAAALARVIRAAAPASARPRVVAVVAEPSAEHLAALTAAIDPDAIQFSGREPVAAVAALPRRERGRRIHLPAEAPDRPAAVGDAVEAARAFLAAGASRILVDTAGGPHPGGTGLRSRVVGRHGGRTRDPGRARRRPDAGQRRRGAARDPGRRRGRGQWRRGTSRPRGAAAQGSVQGRAVREARKGGA